MVSKYGSCAKVPNLRYPHDEESRKNYMLFQCNLWKFIHLCQSFNLTLVSTIRLWRTGMFPSLYRHSNQFLKSTVESFVKHGFLHNDKELEMKRYPNMIHETTWPNFHPDFIFDPQAQEVVYDVCKQIETGAIDFV